MSTDPSPEQETIAILRQSDGLPVAALRPVRCPCCHETIPCACDRWAERYGGADFGYVWCECGGEGCAECSYNGQVWVGEEVEEA